MCKEPNGRKVNINLCISPADKKWLKDHPWVNASGLLENGIKKLRASIENNEFFKPLQ
jgi:hypothetical protein